MSESSMPGWIRRIVLHGHTPGTDLDRARISVESAGWDVADVGHEVDVITTKRDGVCIGTRDLKYREPLHIAVHHIRNHGFHGHLFLDMIHRRSFHPAMQLLGPNGLVVKDSVGAAHRIHLRDEKIVMSMDQMIMFFFRPDLPHRYRHDGTFDHRRLCVLGMWTEAVRAFAGHAQVMQWEPLNDERHRSTMIEAAKEYPTIFYKTPWDSYNALFDQQQCAEDDFRGFRDADMLDRLVPFGSLDNLKRLRDVWTRVK